MMTKLMTTTISYRPMWIAKRSRCSSYPDSYFAANGVYSTCAVRDCSRSDLEYLGLFTSITLFEHLPDCIEAQYILMLIALPRWMTMCPGVAQLPKASHKTPRRTCLLYTNCDGGKCASAFTSMQPSPLCPAAISLLSSLPCGGNEVEGEVEGECEGGGTGSVVNGLDPDEYGTVFELVSPGVFSSLSSLPGGDMGCDGEAESVPDPDEYGAVFDWPDKDQLYADCSTAGSGVESGNELHPRSTTIPSYTR